MDPDFVKSLSARFQQMMAAKKQHSKHPFYTRIMGLARQPSTYTQEVLDLALETIDLARIYEGAEKDFNDETDLGYQDRVIKSLLKYMKTEFFVWVDSPTCSACGSKCSAMGSAAPNAQETAKGASRVELHGCNNNKGHVERFPRYDSPATLLTWRKGRCGEWANCFTLLCLALGSRARWVWNAEDHVWTEVYSTTLKRWVHCDSCENAWDKPLIYTEGWGKKMSYCIAFSADGAMDVTQRYVRDTKFCLPRNMGPKHVLSSAIMAVNQRLRSSLDMDQQQQLLAEDKEEELELKSYQAMLKASDTSVLPPRESGSAEWKHARKEDGPRSPS